MSPTFHTARHSFFALSLAVLTTLALFGGIDAIAQAELTPELMAHLALSANA